MLIEEKLSGKIIEAAIEVHRFLGPGLLEAVYEECLCHEFNLRRIAFERQVTLPLNYKGLKVDAGYRIDVIVEGKIILELKAVAIILPVHEAQLLSYLKLAGKRVGLLINFHEAVLRNGIKRRVL